MGKTGFGKNLKDLREEKAMTQKQLAALLNVTDRSIRDWENEGIEPCFEILALMTKIFDVTAGQLLGLEEY
jgi:transcriptional regulator with XRE-family HTH domain